MSSRLILCIGFFILHLVQAQAKDFNGFFSYSYNEQNGKVSLKIKEFDKDFLLVSYFGSGLGSNDIGFDRGKITSQRLVQFRKYGNRIALIEKNSFYRAITSDQAESKVAADAFASSILFVFNAETDENGTAQIDFSPFLTDDLSNIVSSLKDQKQGNYKLDKQKSFVIPEELFAFTHNVEFESWLSFVGEATGDYLKQIAVNNEIISLRQHISLVALPDANDYKIRKYHPYSGYFDLSYFDYATPIHEPIEKRIIMRHKLQKKNPSSAKSEAVEPIIYYVDRGCPEPIKSALIEGASWWNQAYEAAGYINAFQVKEMPEGAHPLDVRYNTIQWVHRSTRGWSYGSNVHDPRTGEIIKGHVTLGSLRVRQDFMIAQGLLSLYEGDKKDHGPMTLLALARLRQLSAHEVGHTLGLSHNFAASNNDRASVMDYPHPLVTLVDNNISMDRAYDDKIGIWDKRAIIYGYAQLDGDEEKQLKKIIDDTKALGLKYLSDPDARPDGSAAADAHLWDNGANATEELYRVMKIRNHSLARFGLNTIPQGTPLSELEKILVPLYYAHRYQVEATAKAIGGSTYDYSVKGDQNLAYAAVSLADQLKALSAVTYVLQADNLLVNDKLKKLMVPNAYGYNFTRESFKNETGYGFDQMAAATSAIDHVYFLLFHELRLARIHSQGFISLSKYFMEIYNGIEVKNLNQNPGLQIDLTKEKNYIHRLLYLTAYCTKPYIAAAADIVLDKVLNLQIKKYNSVKNDYVQEHLAYVKSIQQKRINREVINVPPPIALPPGAPIGCDR